MILRTMALVGGLTGAAGLSQFPEFSQQYIQRLGGAVDELDRFVTQFDADAASAGMDRTTALAQLEQGGDFGAARADTARQTLDRHARLSADLAALEQAGPFTRARLVRHLRDGDVAKRALEVYKPALPMTFEGAVFGGTGFLAGWLGVSGFFALLGGLFGRRRKRRAVGSAPMT